MATTRAHVTALPPGFIAVRIIQLLFTIINLGLVSFLITRNTFNQITQCILLGFTLLYLIPLIWVILATYKFPRAYNYWAVLALELFCLGLWGYGFLLGAASHISKNAACRQLININEPLSEPDCPSDFNYSLFQVAVNCSWVVLGLTGALLVLQFVSMTVVSVFISKHRRAGGRCAPRSDDYTVEKPASGVGPTGIFV